VYGKVARSPVQSVNREIDEEFHLSLFICHLILVIDGGDLESMPNVHRVISGPMTNEQWVMNNDKRSSLPDFVIN
jgi:hypothetical protein